MALPITGGGVGVRHRYVRPLDGVRGVAIAGVVAYHLGIPGLAGGYLGVDLFFVLSGFLITSLLVEERLETRRLALGSFWGRRARRLLPALLVLLCIVALAAAAGWLAGTPDPATLRADALATLAYVANWHQLFAGQSYFAQFQAPSPLAHTWSLAIEEQFYVLWPLVLVGLFALTSRLALARRHLVLMACSVLGASGSAAWMAWLATHGASVDRLYYGTDTRAFDLLAGATLAVWATGRVQREPRPSAPLWWRCASASAVVVLGLCWWRAASTGAGGPPRIMFEGGFALCALAAVVVLADVVVNENSVPGRVLSSGPLVALGRISYSLYLWHWPIITQVTSATTGLRGVSLGAVRVAATTSLAVASTYLVERPFRRMHFSSWPTMARRALAPMSLAAVGGVVFLGTVPPAFAAPGVPSSPATAPVPEPRPLDAVPAGTAAAPLRITLIGDSVMRDEAPALEAALGATGVATVHDQSYPGWGLAHARGWQQGLLTVLARLQPELLVGTWSWDGSWALSDPSDYRTALAGFAAEALHPTTPGVPGVKGIIFEQFPPLAVDASVPGSEQRAAAVAAWDGAAADVAGRFPGQVAYLPMAPVLQHAGRYASWLPPLGDPDVPLRQWVRVRQVDDTHLCPAGAARYGASLVSALHAMGVLPGVPDDTWWNGPWARQRSIYDDPVGSCPADHPPSG
ncbi:MAG: acyltransferase family protein [Acidimicrobiales bacterium]